MREEVAGSQADAEQAPLPVLLPWPFGGKPARLFQRRFGGWAVTCTDTFEAFADPVKPQDECCHAAVGDELMAYSSPETAASAWNRRGATEVAA
jgi:hypothetical protein